MKWAPWNERKGNLPAKGPADQLAESQGKELKDSVEELKESKESAGHADEEEQAKGALTEGQE